jgi:diacylglycerol kinase family enzyme
MNAEFLGKWDVAPRSHPNDGLLDTFDVTMSVGDRIKARSRLATGTHLPHPQIKQRRVSALQIDVDGLDVWLDGERIGPAKTLSIRVEPDALLCVV